MKSGRSQGSGWVVAQIILMGAQFASALIVKRQWPTSPSRAVGGVLMALAEVLGLPGVFNLGRNLTPLPEPRASGELVTTGIYSYMRHPLYASVIAWGLGWALFWRSRPALVLALAQAVFLRAKAMDEERRLSMRFPDYEEYARRIPRFVPRLDRRGKRHVAPRQSTRMSK